MVHAYATNLGSLTLAVNHERLLLEEPISNSILSLHPAVTLAEGARPRVFTEVDGFATFTDRLEVTWKAIDGVEAATSLHLISKQHMKVTVRFSVATGASVALTAVHPVYVPAEGPGACALGMHELRTLGAGRAGLPPRLLRMQGDAIYSDNLGAWFAPTGNPSLLVALLGAASPVQFVTSGARGKIVSVNALAAAPVPGETAEYTFLLAVGNLDAVDELRAWAESEGAELAPDGLLDIALSGEVTPLEEEEEVVEEPVAVAEEEAADEGVAEEAQEEIAAAGAEPIAETTSAETDIEPWHDDFDPSDLEVKPGSMRCAMFQRALRATEGVWPRWAAGRRYAPLTGMSARTRSRWQTRIGKSSKGE